VVVGGAPHIVFLGRSKVQTGALGDYRPVGVLTARELREAKEVKALAELPSSPLIRTLYLPESDYLAPSLIAFEFAEFAVFATEDLVGLVDYQPKAGEAGLNVMANYDGLPGPALPEELMKCRVCGREARLSSVRRPCPGPPSNHFFSP
jgi:hypothetical protein